MPEWKYLWSEAFKSRYILAAHLLSGCKNIIEIGGYRTPITDFLPLDDGYIDSVAVYDPKLERTRNEWFGGRCGQVRIDHYAMAWKGGIPVRDLPCNLGLALLGLELHLDESGWTDLFRMIQAAKLTVIEYPIAHPHSITQYARILTETGAKVVFQVTLDLAGNDFGDLTDSAPPLTERRIVALTTR